MMKKKLIYFFILIISTLVSCTSDNVEPAFIDRVFGKYDVFTYFIQNPDGTKEYFYNGQTIIISKENGGFIGIKKVVDAVNYPVFSYKEVPDDPKRIRLYKNNAFVGQIWLNSDVAK